MAVSRRMRRTFLDNYLESWAVLSAMNNDFEIPISRRISETKYRYQEAGVIQDKTVRDTWRRVARACAQAEEKDRKGWEARFYRLLEGFKSLPGGRILAGAGTGRQVTLFNCFVMGIIDDSMDGIFDALKESALTMQQGGGIGYDFSTLRPYGTHARGAGVTASGLVSFMHIWDSMCATLLSTGARRGAMMATLRCDHPDIERSLRHAGPGYPPHWLRYNGARGRLDHAGVKIQ
jgi:ribonucleoside-diphosphate reductase alpha chain